MVYCKHMTITYKQWTFTNKMMSFQTIQAIGTTKISNSAYTLPLASELHHLLQFIILKKKILIGLKSIGQEDVKTHGPTSYFTFRHLSLIFIFIRKEIDLET